MMRILAMAILAMAVALGITVPATAECICQCVNGNMQPLCDSSSPRSALPWSARSPRPPSPRSRRRPCRRSARRHAVRHGSVIPMGIVDGRRSAADRNENRTGSKHESHHAYDPGCARSNNGGLRQLQCSRAISANGSLAVDVKLPDLAGFCLEAEYRHRRCLSLLGGAETMCPNARCRALIGGPGGRYDRE
jgi:hypothetical protein